MEDTGIDAATSRMLSARSTIWANPRRPEKFTVKCITTSYELVPKFSCQFLLGFAFSVKGDFSVKTKHKSAEIAQLVKRQTEDLNVPGSIPGFGDMFISFIMKNFFYSSFYKNLFVKRPKKGPHFWRSFILVFLKTIRFASLQTMIHHINNAFLFVPYGKVSLFNFD